MYNHLIPSLTLLVIIENELRGGIMTSKIVEIDIDGVIADIHNGLNPHLKPIYREFDGDTLIENWNMQELNIYDRRLRSKALQLFGDADYIANLKPFDGAIEALVNLYEAMKKTNLEIVFNSNVDNEACVDARFAWFDKYIKPTGISYNANVTCLPKKQKLNSVVIVDDYPENLINSDAPIKIMIRRGHNRYSKVVDFGKFKTLHISNSFVDASVIIRSLILSKEI